MRLKLTDSRIRFTANRDLMASLKANWQGTVQNVKTQFDQLAGDKKMIDRKQFNENPQLAEATTLFDLGDRNSDGKLTAKEALETGSELFRRSDPAAALPRLKRATSAPGATVQELVGKLYATPKAIVEQARAAIRP